MNLEKILKNDKRIWDEEILDYPQLFELARTYDKDLLEVLFNNKESKKKFFIQVGDSYVFKYNEFRFYLEENQVNNSFTQYANKIGLASQGEHLSDSTDYVLDWPYKDCVLEGGMSSEEDMDTFIEKTEVTTPMKMDKKTGTMISPEKTEVTFSLEKRKREEIFYNNIIADKEIDRLLDKKALKNFTRYTAKGEEKVKEIKRDEDGTIKENLLIKGNNLLALHSLKEQFAGKVKLIYIDPPYNTGNDGFAYNDRFNHSTWLTFMKNRLEIAKEFLREDGVIYVSINDHNLDSIKILLQQIFGKENFVNLITIKTKSPSGFQVVNLGVFESAEYLISFAKNKPTAHISSVYQEVEWDESYKLFIKNHKENFTKWEVVNIFSAFAEMKNMKLSGKKPKDELIKQMGFSKFNKEFKEFTLKHKDEICTSSSIGAKAGKAIKEIKTKSQKSKGKIFEAVSTKGEKRYVYNGRELAPYSKKFREVDGKIVPSISITNIWNDINYEGIGYEGSVTFLKGKKPEKLVKRILDMATNEKDIVMDFHLGSGTTAAVSQKMNRQYIGIEQMDYGQNDSVERCLNVINGDTTGISKIVNWKGGGDFIYLELAEHNEEAKNKIDACKSYKELKKLFTELTDYYFLNYNVSVKQFNDQLLDDKDFQELPLEEQKTLFKALLDNNQLYIPHKEQEDGKYNLSKEDQELTNEFYG